MTLGNLGSSGLPEQVPCVRSTGNLFPCKGLCKNKQCHKPCPAPAPDRQEVPGWSQNSHLGQPPLRMAVLQQPQPQGERKLATPALGLVGYSSDDQKSTAANAHLFGFAATLAPLLSREQGAEGRPKAPRLPRSAPPGPVRSSAGAARTAPPSAAANEALPPRFSFLSLPFLLLFTKSEWMVKKLGSDSSVQAALHLETIAMRAADSVDFPIGSSSRGEPPGPAFWVI